MDDDDLTMSTPIRNKMEMMITGVLEKVIVNVIFSYQLDIIERNV